MGIRGSPTAELDFAGVRVPAANLRRRRRRRASSSRWGRSTAAGRGSPPRPSASPRARSRSRRAYARDRRQFGKRIGDFQMVSAMLADMDAATEAARQLLYKACVEIERGLAGRQPLGGDV